MLLADDDRQVLDVLSEILQLERHFMVTTKSGVSAMAFTGDVTEPAL